MLVSRSLEDAGFANGFSTRLGGVSPFPQNDLNLAGFGEDTRENIEENRRRFLQVFGGGYSLATVWQVHGDLIKTAATLAEAADGDDRADGLMSDLTGILAGVKTADCVPVLIGDRRNGAFAAIHAGWRGTAASIVSKAVGKLNQVYNSGPADLVATIGPSAGCQSYEVGKEVIDAFRQNIGGSEKYFAATRPGHALVDLPTANRDQLLGAGVPAEQISVAPLCTILGTDLFFSYRIEKKIYGKTGRLLSVIGRDERI